MGLFGKSRWRGDGPGVERPGRINLSDDAQVHALVEQGTTDARKMFLKDGEFDFRGLVLELFAGSPTDDLEVIRDHTLANGRTIEELYESEYGRHWEGMDQAAREAELIGLVRFDNAMAEVDLSDSNDPDADRLWLVITLLHTKVQALAIAYDALYETSLQIEIMDNPPSVRRSSNGVINPPSGSNSFHRRLNAR